MASSGRGHVQLITRLRTTKLGMTEVYKIRTPKWNADSTSSLFHWFTTLYETIKSPW